MDLLKPAADVVAAAYSLRQGDEFHDATIDRELQQHKEEIKLLKEQHSAEICATKQSYLISTFTDLEQFCQELNENLIDSTRDAERDMVDQRNQQYQTLLIAGTIVLAALLTVLIQGVLPKGSTSEIIVFYSLSSVGSIVFIVLNMLLCIQITFRVSRFMYRRSDLNLQYLRDAMENTRSVMNVMRGDAMHSQELGGIATEPSSNNLAAMNHNYHHNNCNNYSRNPTYQEQQKQQQQLLRSRSHRIISEDDSSNNNNNNSNNNNYYDSSNNYNINNSFINSGNNINNNNNNINNNNNNSSNNSGSISSNNYNNNSAKNNYNNNYIINNNNNNNSDNNNNRSRIENQWMTHESKIYDFLQKRGEINQQLEVGRKGIISFEEFWRTHCSALGNIATFCFYAGTALMLTATSVHLWAKFVFAYGLNSAAIVAVLTISLSLLLALGLAMYLRFFDGNIIELRQQVSDAIAREAAEERRDQLLHRRR